MAGASRLKARRGGRYHHVGLNLTHLTRGEGFSTGTHFICDAHRCKRHSPEPKCPNKHHPLTFEDARNTYRRVLRSTTRLYWFANVNRTFSLHKVDRAQIVLEGYHTTVRVAGQG